MHPDLLGLPFENVSFPSTDGVPLKGWFIPAEGSEKTIIVCHGWGAEMSNVLPSTAFLHKGGYNLFYFDFRNHGESGGTVSSIGPLESRDFEAAIQFLQKNKAGSVRWMGVFGLSMGGAVSLTMTAHKPILKAVVAESSFSSFNESVARYAKLFYGVPRIPLVPITLFFVRWRLGMDPEEFSPLHHIHRISPRPVLLIQGDEDIRMPPSEGRILYEKAREPKELWTVPGADHGEAHSKDPQTYERKVLEFYGSAP